MKNNLLLIGIIAVLSLMGCKEYPVSYLTARNLNYPLNSLTIVQGLTQEDIYQPEGTGGGLPGVNEKVESKYKARILNKAPWLSSPFWGASVEGSRPLTIEISDVKVSGPLADAEKLRKNVTIYGEGIFSVPFENDIPVGRYLVSLKISNISGSEIVEDCFTIIVTDVKW